ncbi:MAG TPA: DUF4382 domain-containing protein [Flavobacterium sp.]|jgi:hypothetical protein
MKSIKKMLLCGLGIATMATIGSCSDEDTNKDFAGGTSRMTVRMTDAPGDYDEVNVEVLDVMIKGDASASEEGWVSVGNVTPGIYNLLDLTGGVNVLLADNEVEAGHLGQIRLILGDNNTVVKDGVTYDLNTPSAQQSGLKLQVNQDLEADLDYNFLIDFDVAQSVVSAGNSGNYNLHPVLRIVSEANGGSIRGHVIPGPYQILASVSAGSQTISSFADQTGNFVLQGVPEGTYTVTITSSSSLSASPVTIQNVTVVSGEVSQLGEIAL